MADDGLEVLHTQLLNNKSHSLLFIFLYGFKTRMYDHDYYFKTQ